MMSVKILWLGDRWVRIRHFYPITSTINLSQNLLWQLFIENKVNDIWLLDFFSAAISNSKLWRRIGISSWQETQISVREVWSCSKEAWKMLNNFQYRRTNQINFVSWYYNTPFGWFWSIRFINSGNRLVLLLPKCSWNVPHTWSRGALIPFTHWQDLSQLIF